MSVKDELMNILQRVWNKLQDLPQASPLEVGAFSILILFAATVLFLIVLSFVSCCCCGKSKYHTSRVQPL
ncbi:hypothetical protein Q5P01_023870 [Channa striata]|uniref:Small integral membrane protein 5 n=1 Tax=Channa striata TaxID=64152 RepID=A0AA88LR39_CHASR|nr:hypothetical protein Q5P01_023870 [Channa striata]